MIRTKIETTMRNDNDRDNEQDKEGLPSIGLEATP
jgi:hypothetical protein